MVGGLETQTDDNYRIQSVKESANVYNVDISETASVVLLAWRAENNHMFKRLGNLRRGDGGSGDWIVGGAFSYTDGESSFAHGSGDNYQFGFAALRHA